MSNAYFLAKFRFDTPENEPAKNLQKIYKNLQFTPPPGSAGEPGGQRESRFVASGAREGASGATERRGAGLLALP